MATMNKVNNFNLCFMGISCAVNMTEIITNREIDELNKLAIFYQKENELG